MIPTRFVFFFSLQPLASFISAKMKAVASMFDINDDYIHSVSANIQNAVALVGYGKVRNLRDLAVIFPR